MATMMKSGKYNTAQWGNRLGYMILPFHIAKNRDPLEYVLKATEVAGRKKSSMESIFTFWSGLVIMKIFGIKALTIHYQSYMNIVKLVLAADEAQFPDVHDLLDDFHESLKLIREAASEKNDKQLNDKREAKGLIPRNREPSYDSYDQDYKPYMHQAPRGWNQPEYFAMVMPEDEEEVKKPHGKVRMESLKLITTNYASPKCKHSGVDAGTYEKTTAHTSTTKKVTLNTRISVKPMGEWDFKLNDEPAPPIKPLMRTKHRISLLEKQQKNELFLQEILRRRLLYLDNKKELNEVVEVMTDAMNSTRSKLQKALRRISALEKSNRNLHM
ncbi:hypothetical protein QYE76_049049 [Lolium multiflorum]|uniref:O-acyltransferase WSD1 C-terminal domain-containing protein n=1 Tax=Lolium multiflorum TaxID=4521 RepID=A0AAD8SN38_LOLMU|nr:hypothetical protein QYE76_049049 [Lolium multiflorum]